MRKFSRIYPIGMFFLAASTWMPQNSTAAQKGLAIQTELMTMTGKRPATDRYKKAKLKFIDRQQVVNTGQITFTGTGKQHEN